MLTLRPEIPAYGGFALARLQGKVILIKGAIPGELVTAIVEKEEKDFSRATVVEILEPSPFRTQPHCKFFGRCGGCQLQFMTHEFQVQMKEEILKNNLKRIGKIEQSVADPIISEKPWNYRLRGQFKIHDNAAGFYMEKTRTVVDIDYCPLMSEKVNKLFINTKRMLTEMRSEEIHISAGETATVLLKISEGTMSGADERISDKLLQYGFEGVIIQKGKTSFKSWGQAFTILELDGIKYTVSPLSFFQANWPVNLKVLKEIIDMLDPLKDKRIIDLYSGAGNFILPLTQYASDVIAVEENPHAVKDGIRNLEMNNIQNCRFITSKAEEYNKLSDCDALILDPPRPGLTDRVCRNILTSKPKQLIYVSCNPSTFARDLKKLSTAYELSTVKMIDFFPQTYHIESVAVLNLR